MKQSQAFKIQETLAIISIMPTIQLISRTHYARKYSGCRTDDQSAVVSQPFFHSTKATWVSPDERWRESNQPHCNLPSLEVFAAK